MPEDRQNVKKSPLVKQTAMLNEVLVKTFSRQNDLQSGHPIKMLKRDYEIYSVFFFPYIFLFDAIFRENLPLLAIFYVYYHKSNYINKTSLYL